jgi:regulator of protease activity HflC (stomatin/prohibitin superfamily)
MAKQAEAEREKRAKIISAQGEFEASQKLAEAAKVLGEQKDAITLRYLETMREISGTGNNTTSFFPVPINFLEKVLSR